jgi:predicted O-methyltransferase YrrM
MERQAYEFTNNWFELSARAVWDEYVPQLKPAKVLEIGSYEGASARYLIENAQSPMEIHCIDTWEGAAEHARNNRDMGAVERRFHRNIELAKSRSRHRAQIDVHKGPSSRELAKMLASDFRGYFDMVYIDGSHFAPDVMTDAVLSFLLLKVGGHMFFDDYIWRGKVGSNNPFNGPKLGIDAFTNVFYYRLRVLWSPNSQVVARKTAD